MPAYINYTDAELISLLNSGDEAAFTEIYDRYWEKMVSYGVRLTQSEDEAADIVQEIFISLWNRKEILTVKGTLAAYLIKSTRNLSLRYIEKNITRYDFLETLTKSMQNTPADFIDHVVTKQLQENVDSAVEKLPAKMRQIYILSRDEQLSHREISQKLGIAENTVKKQINNALKILSNTIGREFSAPVAAFFLYFLK